MCRDHCFFFVSLVQPQHQQIGCAIGPIVLGLGAVKSEHRRCDQKDELDERVDSQVEGIRQDPEHASTRPR